MKTTAKRSLSRLAGQYSYILVFVAVFLVWALTSSSLTWSGVMNIFRHSAIIGALALGMGLVCLTGEIDLSVGSILAMDAGLSVVVFNATGSILFTLVFALAAGALLGGCERGAGGHCGNARLHRDLGHHQVAGPRLKAKFGRR